MKQLESGVRQVSLAAMVTLIATSTALAQPDEAPRARMQAHEPWYATFDTGVIGPLNDPVDRLFNAGGAFGAAMYGSIIPEVALGGRVEGGFLGEGSPIPQEPLGAGVLGYALIGPSLRLRPFASIEDRHREGSRARRSTGFHFDFGPALSFTAGHIIPAYQAAVGYNFEIGPITIGPFTRFTHFIETEGRFGDNHIVTWSAGIEVAFLDYLFTDAPARASSRDDD